MFRWIHKLFKRFTPSRIYYGFVAAKNDRLTADWILPGRLGLDQLLKWALPVMRERSRDLARNDPYFVHFLRLLKINVIGPHGIKLQAKIRTENGDVDVVASRTIEQAWQRWAKRYAEISQRCSLTELLRIILVSVARDGEVLIRLVRNADNPFGFALQVIEADYLDDSYNDERGNNQIVMGVEKGRWGRPVAYWLLTRQPGDQRAERVRVPAEDIIHLFIRDYISQTRGVPWPHAAMLRLRMLGAYQEAEVVAARIAAAKMGFFVESFDAPYQQPSQNYDMVTEVEPGVFKWLPPGVEFKPFDPGTPHAEFDDFTKAILRSVSSGLGCSYNELAGDYESVNYSSLRAAKLTDRDLWSLLQQWLIESVLEPIYEEWLRFAILKGAVPYSAEEFNRLTTVRWQPRRWDWVDPLKDVQAKVLELQHGLSSRTQICAERGIDFEDVLEELRREKELMDKYGISIISGDKPIIVVEGDSQNNGEGRKHHEQRTDSRIEAVPERTRL